MIKWVNSAIAATIGLAVSACVIQSQNTHIEQVQNYIDLLPAHFKNTTRIQDDFLDTIATFSTEPGFKAKEGLLGAVWWDDFIRAHVDKKTGRRTFQIYVFIMYNAENWRFLTRANYETPNGPVSQSVTKIFTDVSCAGSLYSGCRYEEHIGFNVPEEVLLAAASQYESTKGKMLAWRFKIVPSNGPTYQGAISAAEIKGLLDAVEQRYPRT